MARSLRAGLEAEGYIVEVSHDGEAAWHRCVVRTRGVDEPDPRRRSYAYCEFVERSGDA
jgi:hypothetical protein